MVQPFYLTVTTFLEGGFSWLNQTILYILIILYTKIMTYFTEFFIISQLISYVKASLQASLHLLESALMKTMP